MPCDSVATASAQVDQKFLNEILAGEEGQKALLHWLQSQFQKVEVISQNLVYGITVEVEDNAGGWYMIDLYGQEITVQTGNRQSESQLGPIRDKVAAFVKDLGGALLQQRIAAAIGRRYSVVESATAPNKALVLKVRL